MVARRFLTVVRAPATAWFALLVVVLTGTLTVSVRIAMHAPDTTMGQPEVRAVRYAALGGLSEVGFEADGASSQTFGSVIALPYEEPTFHDRDRNRTRPPVPDPTPTPPIDDDDDDDDGEEITAPLLVTAVADRRSAAQGDRIIYTFSVTNVSEQVHENIIAETHVPAGTYAAGSCTGFTNEGTLDAPMCVDLAGLPASGSDDRHLLRAIGTMQPGATARWELVVRVGSDTADAFVIGNHCRVRTTAAVIVPSSDVWVTVV